MTAPLPPFILAGRISVRAVMVRALDAARGPIIVAKPWRERMRECLVWSWACAKRALAVFQAAKAASKLQLDRAGALVVLGAIQARTVNLGLDIVTAARALPDLDAVLAYTRDAFRPLSDADRAAVLEVARAAAKPSATVLPLRRAARYPDSYGRTFTRGSRAFSHGW